MVNNYQLLPYEPNMLEACVRLYQDVFSGEPWYEDSDDADVRRLFQDFYSMNAFTGYVLKGGERIVAFSIGFIKPYINGMEYYIDQFCVDACLQGQGVGSFFMEQIKYDLGGKGIHAAILCTEAGYPAYGFYVKNGFSELADTRFLVTEF